MVNRCENLGDSGRDGSVHVLSIDLEACRDLMVACIMARMQSLGWTESEARLAADEAIEKMVQRAPACLERVSLVCGHAASSGADQRVVDNLARAEFALGGVQIADDLNKSRLAGMN